MISCPKCRKENQDHYKFCLGCGAELPRDAAPKVFSPRTPPHGIKAVAQPSARGSGGTHYGTPEQAALQPVAQPSARGSGGTPAVSAQPAAAPAPAPAPFAGPQPVPSVPRPVSAAPAPVAPAPMPAPAPAMPAPPAAAPAAETVTCPQCGHVNATAFKFCASCGHNLTKVAASAPPPPAAAPAPAVATSVCRLTVLRADGTDAGTYDVPAESTVVGRDLGGIFGGDAYLSPQHARLTVRNGSLFVMDVGSVNGTYIRLKRDCPEPIADGQLFRIGQEILRFERLKPEPPVDDVEVMGSPSAGYIGRIVLITGLNQTGNAFPIPQPGVHVGRERGHVLFPEDGYVSGLHCSLTTQGDTVLLTDLGSSNGTFLRLMTEREVHDGDILLMGQQLFRVNL